MVGARTSNARPFNIATNGHRQPGSAFNLILVRALETGAPDSTWESQPKTFSRAGYPKVSYDEPTRNATTGAVALVATPLRQLGSPTRMR